MHNKLLYFLLAMLLCSCQKETINNPFPYPDSKAWAHQVNTLEEAKIKSSVFEGLETDLYYSPSRDQLLVGHNPEDTLVGLTLDTWIEAVEKPAAHYFWFDMKNLTTENATRIANNIIRIAEKWHITNHIMIERWDVSALKIIKSHGLYVILWTDNPYQSGQDEEKWRINLQYDIEELHPDAISGDSQLFPLLPESFPEQNIHLWDTPKEYNEANVEHTLMLMGHPAVKVVLVDYPEPVTP